MKWYGWVAVWFFLTWSMVPTEWTRVDLDGPVTPRYIGGIVMLWSVWWKAQQ